jgi:DNA-binding ferritin-like protein
VLQDEPLVLMPTEMMTTLYSDIEQVVDQLDKAFESAAKENKQGIANYIAERIDAYEKHLWMIRSILKATA